jgi:hypothetical protein
MLSNAYKVLLEAFARGYRVSPSGEVISPRGDKIKTIINGGYYKFTIKVEGIKQNVPVHRLAVIQRFGPESLVNSKIQVRHLDGNSLNNSEGNLVPGTHQENMLDRPKELRKLISKKAQIASKLVTRKFTDEQVALIRAARHEGLTYKQLQEKWKCSKSTLSFILSPTARRKASY